MSDWVQCARCRHVWDDANSEHLACACIETHGNRGVYKLDSLQIELVENATTNYSAAAVSATSTEPDQVATDKGTEGCALPPECSPAEEQRANGQQRAPAEVSSPADRCPGSVGAAVSPSPYDSRPETRAHIARVRDFIGRAKANLAERAWLHDASKLVSPEREAFDIATPKLAGLEYGSEEYKQSLRDLGPALQHHFEHNDHHPEHFEDGVRGMSLMALVEMLCDWRAASERVKQRTDDPEKVKTFEAGLAYNQERFGYSDELAEILFNTARELGML